MCSGMPDASNEEATDQGQWHAGGATANLDY